MDIHINYLAIVLSVLSSMMIGYFWYGSLKFGFGKKWSTLANIDLAKSSTPLALVSAGVSAAVLAYGLAVATALVNQASGNSFLSDALMTGLFIWFCFQALRMFQRAQFNQNSTTETAIHVGNELATVLAASLIIGLLGV